MRARLRAAAPALGLLLAAALLAASRGLDEITRGDQLGPGFWPRVVLLGLGLACAAKLVAEWRRRPAPLPRGTVVDLEPEEFPAISRSRLVTGMLLIVLYVLATPWIGFPLTNAAFIVGFMWLGGTRSVPALSANAVLGTVGLLYLFVKFVYLPLPKGDGPFEAVTLGLYRMLHLL